VRILKDFKSNFGIAKPLANQQPMAESKRLTYGQLRTVTAEYWPFNTNFNYILPDYLVVGERAGKAELCRDAR
jgi:hypothetical protein